MKLLATVNDKPTSFWVRASAKEEILERPELAERLSLPMAASELSDLKMASLAERRLRRKLDGGNGHSV